MTRGAGLQDKKGERDPEDERRCRARSPSLVALGWRLKGPLLRRFSPCFCQIFDLDLFRFCFVFLFCFSCSTQGLRLFEIRGPVARVVAKRD